MTNIDLESLQHDLAFFDFLNRPSSAHGYLEHLLIKKENIKLKMYQEKGHHLPHFHVDYCKEIHTATYSIETGKRIEGTLSRKYDRTIGEWTQTNKDKLLGVWSALQAGQSFIIELGPL